jgi:hypothetical protein
MPHDVYAMKKSIVDECIGGSRKGKKICKTTQEVGSPEHKGQMQMWTEYEPWCAEIEY